MEKCHADYSSCSTIFNWWTGNLVATFVANHCNCILQKIYSVYSYHCLYIILLPSPRNNDTNPGILHSEKGGSEQAEKKHHEDPQGTSVLHTLAYATENNSK